MRIARARVIEPARGVDEVRELSIGDRPGEIDAKGLIATPGFIDLHAHLREPGFEESETIATGARAALAGGFTTVCCMANTEPTLDAPGLLEEVLRRAAAARAARVLPIAAITRGRKGETLADLTELAAAGAVAFSDDGAPLQDARLMRHALEYARASGRAVADHAQDAALAGSGVMHEGEASARLGLAGIPDAAEETAVARDIALARITGSRLHLAHVSSARAVALVRSAKRESVPVTCEVTPHHLAMTDEWVAGARTFAWEDPNGAASPYDASTKVNPPLRTRADVDALWEALRDGTIDAIATDHAPHASVYKEVEYDRAAFGISGLETALATLLGAVAAGWIDLRTLVERLTLGPARCFGLPAPSLERDLVLIDPDAEWTVTPESLVSRGKNTPLAGKRLRGRVVAAFVDGEQRLG
ncbi:MAG TPA: dihydroorotase [Candidatus Dormibacteraeota bacterium]|nr:dihydroorotase [Candidatus Dormibacteraeota bacterium]